MAASSAGRTKIGVRFAASLADWAQCRRPTRLAANLGAISTVRWPALVGAGQTEGMPAKGAAVQIGERTIKVTNLDKIMYPATGTTKGDVIAYYAAVAEWFVPHARGRPATRKRWVDGVGTEAEPGHAFFNKNLDY